MQPWIIPSLKQVVWSYDDFEPPEFVHVSTIGDQSSDPQSGPTGHSVWIAKSEGTPAAIAWEWVVLDHGSVAMTDPMAIVTNIGFAHGDGSIIEPTKAALQLNRIVHDLPWQTNALRAFRNARRIDGRRVPVRPWARRRQPAGLPLPA